MHDFPSTSSDEQQWHPHAGAGAGCEARASIDLSAAEWFCRTVDECADAAARAANIRGGLLVLSSFGERPVANDLGSWKQIDPRNKVFALGQHRAMAEHAVAWAKDPGRNVYLSMTVHPRSLGGNKRGTAAEALGVIGLGADLDRDKGCEVRIEDLPLPPTIVICSSRNPAKNFNLLWLFNRLITVEEARPMARALADVVRDADGGTADPTHIWRVPGTLNWPKKAKVARGRPLTPQPVHLDSSGAML